MFGITCDELLRGERKSPSERSGLSEDNEPTPKGEKQLKRLLSSALSQYRTRTYISVGISVIGFIAALIGNLALFNAILGFLLGAVFFAASIVCQAVFLNRAFLCVDDSELEISDIHSFKRSVILLGERTIGLNVGFIGFTSPLLIFMEASMGLGADSLFIYGSIGEAVFLFIYAVVCWFLNARLLEKGVYSLSEKETNIYHRNHKLQRNCAIALVSVLIVTFFIHHVSTQIWGPYSIMGGTVFNDYESFIEFMEQDIPLEPMEDTSGVTMMEDIPVDQPEYYDEDGNVISEVEAMRRTITDQDGNILCEYTDRNESVVSISYSIRNGSALPITVRTQSDLQEARAKVAARQPLFGALYCIEIIGVLAFYLLKKAK